MASYCPKIHPADWCEPELTSNWHRVGKRTNDVERKLQLIDELIARTLAPVQPAEEDASLSQRLQVQADQWEKETAHLSSPLQRMIHPSYQAILGMGAKHKEAVVRFLLHDMQENRRDWLLALSYLTQENPINPKDAGKTDKLVASWLSWGRKEGLL